jgi:hypothetical protein
MQTARFRHGPRIVWARSRESRGGNSAPVTKNVKRIIIKILNLLMIKIRFQLEPVEIQARSVEADWTSVFVGSKVS